MTKIKSVSLVNVGQILLGIIVLIVTSKLVVNLPTGVPITLQTSALMVIATTMSTRKSLSVVLGWLSLILIGLPVSTSLISGPAAFFGPTSGYLFAFIICSIVTTSIFTKISKSTVNIIFVNFLVNVIFLNLIGYTFLFFINTLIGFNFIEYMSLYIVGDLIKLAIAVCVIKVVNQ